MTQTAPAGWFLDASGLQYRYWDGAAWTHHVSPAVPPPSMPTTGPTAPTAPVGPVQWFEPLLYVVLLVVWFGTIFGVASGVAHASLDGKVAYTQEQHDQYAAEASASAQAAGVIVALIGLAVIASKTGYRARDTFIQLIPVVGWVIALKLLWRLACIHRRYWSPAPGATSATDAAWTPAA